MRTFAHCFLFGALLVQVACGGSSSSPQATVPSPPTNLRYSSNPAVYTVGTAITPNVPASDGGAVVSYLVGPALPAGLTLNVTTGVISGTPTAAQAAKAYSIAASNNGGTTTANFTLTVLDLPPTQLIYSANPATYTTGVAIAPNAPTHAGGAVLSYSVNPALPAGLVLDTATGVVAGVPGVAAATAGYTVTASNSGGSTVATLTLTVTQGTAPDLRIAKAYLVQSSQDLEGSVPLVAGRDALLRVFPVANLANGLNPLIHVEMRNGATAVWAKDLHATALAVPLTVNEANFPDSCNVLVPGDFVQPGYTLVAVLDPNNALVESDKTNNTFTFTPTIQAVKVFKVTLVQVIQQNNLTGNVVGPGRTLASWTDRLKRMYPIQTVDAALAPSPYTTTANLNTSDSVTQDRTGWEQLLLELETKRTVEAADRYYFGCVNVSYTGGTAGIGYTAGSATSSGFRTALGWDKTSYQDGGNYPEVMAHEVGHNFGREHAPCGLTVVDPNWPTAAAYANAHIGVWGWDPNGGVASGALKNPAVVEDIMSYCSGNMWVSDYTYKGVLAWRAASPLGLEAAATTGLEECLVVTGMVRNGQVELGPSFQVLTRPTAVTAGPYALTLHDGHGAELQRVAFAPTAVADPAEGQAQEHFVLAVAINGAQRAALRRIRVQRGDGFHVERSSGDGGREPREPVATALGDGRTYLSWDQGAHPFVLVRDAATGEVLSLGQGGAATLASSARTLELTLSDGVRSGRKTLTVLE